MAQSTEPKDSTVSYKDTLNLPRTDFPIRPQPKIDDPIMLERWEREDLYKEGFEHNRGNEKFILHDGPPYANGSIHLGHAYNKILKDIICKAQRMSGKHVPVTPGWDCHGLPIELKVSQEQPGLDAVALKKACRTYATQWIDVQRSEFKKLGLLMDWDRPYKTMDPLYQASIVRAFGAMVKEGFIERKNKTVPWCFSCQTVLAAAEIEYQDRKDPSLYVLFQLEASAVDRLVPSLSGHTVSLVIWTTTPWTLPLNRAVMVHPDSTYSVLEIDGRFVVVGSSAVGRMSALVGKEPKTITTFSAREFLDAKVKHPFDEDRWVPVIPDASVSLEDGTACVHSAPGCGPEDYEVGVRYGLEIYSPLSPDGRYTKGIVPTELEGMSIVDAQGWVIKQLLEKNRLLHKGSITHSYPHCWRCHKGLMFRATQQWFCNLSHHNLREKALKAIECITFIPERASHFLKATIGNRLEWCLSRQRTWGVPIPALLCSNKDYAYLDAALIEHVAHGVARDGIEYWDTVSIHELAPKNLRCPVCSSTMFVKEKDILDVWFDSGVSHYAVLAHNKDLSYPADMYLEGVDQHRGWFQSSLLTSLVLHGRPSMKSIMTHGFTVDDQGRKMSKSLGNVVAPQQLIDDMGTDGLRLWAASISSEGDAIVSATVLNNVKEVFRKVRNTCRFLISNLYDFEVQQHAVSFEQLRMIDRRALFELANVSQTVRQAYERADLTVITQELARYCAHDLSAVYLDVIKDRLYVERADGLERRSAQTACFFIVDTLTKLIAPVFSFTAEQITDQYQKQKTSSVHLQSFVEIPAAWTSPVGEVPVYYSEAEHARKVFELAREASVVERVWEVLDGIRDALLKAIEPERERGVIKHSLEAKVTVYFDMSGDERALLSSFFKELAARNQTKESFFKEWLIVSEFDFATSDQGLSKSALEGLYVGVTRARGVKCPRCWHWTSSTHEHGLCKRCEAVCS